MLDILTSSIENILSNIFINNFFLASLLIFLVIFCETGLVVTPFLPGDSLLFLLGTLLSSFNLSIAVLFFILLSTAAIFGNIINYYIGRKIGKVIISKNWLKKDYLLRTEKFYKKYGAKTIILSRFVPIIRTIAPFVAGIGKMDLRKFIIFNFIGGISWVFLFLFSGYFFGNLPIVQKNLSLVIISIIIISLIPTIIHFIKSKS